MRGIEEGLTVHYFPFPLGAGGQGKEARAARWRR
jgi:hypothetical protein